MTALPGWRVQRSEIVYESLGDETLAAPLARPRVKTEAPRPQAVISVTRGPTEQSSAPEALALALLELAKMAPGFVTQEQREVRLEDGAIAHAVIVSFDPAPGLRATQLHLARLDGATFAHATATVEAHRAKELLGLEATMKALLGSSRAA